jgi:hypothetical protein
MKQPRNPTGFTLHIDRATEPADYDRLNPNSLDTDCRACGSYYEVEWPEGERPPETLTCPHCGSHDHGCVTSPAGAYDLAMWDPNLP